MQSLKLVMMGTGSFAVPTFRKLYDTPHQVVGLYTQPDRAGSGRHHHVNPMKELALARRTPVFQPPKINTPESLAELAALGADLFVVAAYGQILSQRLLKIPPRGSINVHASLLPKYRGAAPIHFAVLNGEPETGVCIIEVQLKLDAGPVLGCVRTPIGLRDTSGDLEPRLAEMGADLAARVLDEIAAGTETRVPQDDAGATYAPKMTKELGAIDWTRPAEAVDWHLRAMQPWPTPYTYLHEAGKPPRRFVIRQISPSGTTSTAAPGEVVAAEIGQFLVQTGSGAVRIDLLQPEGKRVLTADEFLRGTPIPRGARFGPVEPT